ncbi:MAG: flagellar basal body rod protein FlgB [Candidatus Acididesulfobacter guangdongensis]|uniref:Flagellar basal body rod protein FlgB n=1 Tax=Acididesulfobacter guangdongensis TaxID=2597225 RepID=A0A519BG22_ACIG2|nr:MAG: flagellar basal body rod protein FlgB [Candidatus Acididesulfobacter guangdongensis]
MELFGKIYGVLDESLNVLSARQNVIASNIANANTPGYKEKTVNFEKIMQDAVGSENSLNLKTNSPKDFINLGVNNINNSESFSSANIEAQKVQSVPALDGNTVNMGTEMAEMSANAIRFEAVSTLLSKKFTMLNYAITQTTP